MSNTKKAYRFGIELELFVPEYWYDRTREQLADIKGVEITDDGSINADSGCMGIELRIGVFGFQGLERTISKVCRVLANNEARVNNSCGFHLHISNKRFQTRKYVNRIIHSWLALEDVMISLQPPSRLNNRYCMRLLAQKITNTSLDNLPKAKRQLISQLSGINRYHALNLSSLSLHGTIENRLHSATLEKDKIMNWVRLQRAFYDYALNDYKPEVIEKLLHTEISDSKVNGVFELLKLEDSVKKFYHNRLRTMLFTHLKRQNEVALKVLTLKDKKAKLMKKYREISNELEDIRSTESEAVRLFDRTIS